VTTKDPTTEGRNRSIRTCKAPKIENDQLKTSQEVPQPGKGRRRTVARHRRQSKQSMTRRELNVNEDLLARALAIIAADLALEREQRTEQADD
jgi:hypothetical protein